MTVWGDDGGECDLTLCLPGFLYYGNHAYTSDGVIDEKLVSKMFTGICEGSLEHFVQLNFVI